MFEKLYTAIVTFLDRFFWMIDFGPSIHKFFLTGGVGNFREFLGRVRAVRLYRHALKKVPAYRKHLAHKKIVGPKVSFTKVDLRDIPEMDKASYIKKHSITDKIWNGVLPERGIMFDESSGSSGTPTSWVRGSKERKIVQRVMQVVFRHYIENRKPIIINTFSMGAWADRKSVV